MRTEAPVWDQGLPFWGIWFGGSALAAVAYYLIDRWITRWRGGR